MDGWMEWVYSTYTYILASSQPLLPILPRYLVLRRCLLCCFIRQVLVWACPRPALRSCAPPHQGACRMKQTANTRGRTDRREGVNRLWS
mmetsp:Transcript_6069/g.14580  ORF Transcript_6069/g.14580 Transcript_6069/m.14580 type:complete len:89 (+) Transcript_6069:966-1232(+)